MYLIENYKDNLRFNRQYEEISKFLQIVADNGYNEHFHWGVLIGVWRTHFWMWKCYQEMLCISFTRFLMKTF